MKNLLYKEFRLAIHPSVYIFFALAALLLVPSYPYYVSFFYLTLGIFLTFKTNRAENDIFYSALLPVRKGDVVRARVLTVALLELANILIAIPFAVISAKINPAGGNNAGIEPNVAFFGLSFLMYGGFNLIFFPVFYKTGRSEGKAFLWGGVFTFLYIIAAESLAQYIPSPVSAYLDTPEKSAQLRQLPRCAQLSDGFSADGVLEPVKKTRYRHPVFDVCAALVFLLGGVPAKRGKVNPAFPFFGHLYHAGLI